MEWLADNWFWILVFLFFIRMHMGGHGCHGGHGGHRHNHDDAKQPKHSH